MAGPANMVVKMKILPMLNFVEVVLSHPCY